MRIRDHLPHDARRPSRIDEIVDDEQPSALAASNHIRRNLLEHLQFTLIGVIVASDTHSLDHPDAEFACDNRGGDEATAGDADHCLKRPGAIEPPGQGAGIPVELVP
jgi:hypothetical protein